MKLHADDLTVSPWAKVLGLASISALALTACGGDDGGGDDGDQPAEGEAEAEAQVEADLDVDVESDDLQLIEDGTLKVCSDVPYPPFEYFDDNGDVVGFDIDIAQGIADVLEVELEVVQTGFEGIQSGVALNSESCDLAISGMTITEERAGNMLFSEPYLDDNLALLSPVEGDIDGLDALDGQTVGVQSDTTGADYAEGEGFDVREYPDSGLLLQGLESGQVDAAIGNISILGYQAGENPDFGFDEEIDTGEQLGVAAQSDNQDLIDAVDEILAEMDSSGYMDDIEEQWFGDGETPEEGEDAAAEDDAEGDEAEGDEAEDEDDS
ncbi:ABC transporter substrate-binding protein [Nesterenkonia marinintestina]|uniref:ABC transporter substrate-binding protein n=1 Tax=Nesterenkonia marinintestina TaxID=2979865 RepID=UPI0021C0A7F8|nr:ABC transporter substrate-binding protein [Nesterenkonia sp. GX14115]